MVNFFAIISKNLYYRGISTLKLTALKPLLLLFPLFLFSFNKNNQTTENNITNSDSEESFLSTVEYGKLLYINPRGISCAKCHGKTGKGGKKIAKYYDKNKNPKILKCGDIRGYSLEDLNASLQNQYRENHHRQAHKIMPMYYLTDKEIKAIHAYLQRK